MKNINWKNIGTIVLIVVIGIVTSPIWLAPIQKVVRKLPIIGSKF